MSLIEARANLLNGNLDAMWPRPENDFIPDDINYDIYRYQFPERLDGLSWEEAVKVFIRAGILAPSSHNMQARFYKIDKSNLNLRIIPDGKYIGGPSDATGREAVIGVGTAAENIIETMWAYGLAPSVTINYQAVEGKKLVGIEFNMEGINEGVLSNPNIIQLMQMRRVYRGPFDRARQVPLATWESMEELVPNGGIKIKIQTDRPSKVILAGLQYAADNVVLQNSDFRSELGIFMAANNTEENRVMPGCTFGLNDNDAAQLKDQLAAGGLLRGAFAAGFPQADRDAIISAHGIVVIVANEDKPDYWLKTGIAMERAWLFAQSHGLGVGVMAGMVEVAAKAKDLLKVLGVSGVPAAVMRMGIPLKEYWPRSPRVAVEEVMGD